MQLDIAFLESIYGDKIPQRIEQYRKAIALCQNEVAKQHPHLKLSFAEATAERMAYLYFYLKEA